MKKKFYDIIPQEKRSIRNIPLLSKSESGSDVGESTHHLEEGSIEPKDQPVDYVVDPAFVSNNDKYQEEVKSFSGHIHEDGAEVAARVKRTRKNVDGIKVTKSQNRTEGGEDRKSDNDTEANHTSERVYVANNGDLAPRYSAQAKVRREIEDDEVDPDIENLKINGDFEEWEKTHKGKSLRNSLVLLSLVALAFILMSTTFASAKISIVPTTKEVVVDDTKILLSEVEHKIIDVESSKEITLESSGLTQVNRKASGTVILYNDFNTASQALVANTRLETSNGLIFFIKEKVTIPGRKTVNGKSVPGSVEATIEASEAGEKYNVGLKDFKLVAYKGSDRYDKIYARSKTSIGNGFVGEVPNVSQSTINTSIADLKKTVADDLKARVIDKLNEKDGEIFVDGMMIVEYATAKQDPSRDGKKVDISMSAKAKAVIVNKNSLARFLNRSQEATSATSTTDIANQITYTGNTDMLAVRFPVDAKMADMSRETAYAVASGTSTITSVVDIEKVARAVSGLTREQAIPAIKAIVDLENLEVSLSPWWRSKLPHAEKIKIEIEG